MLIYGSVNLIVIYTGVVPADLLGIIRILASQGQFSVEDYNKSLEKLHFSSYEAGDKPFPVPTSRSSKITKLKVCIFSHNLLTCI